MAVCEERRVAGAREVRIRVRTMTDDYYGCPHPQRGMQRQGMTLNQATPQDKTHFLTKAPSTCQKSVATATV